MSNAFRKRWRHLLCSRPALRAAYQERDCREAVEGDPPQSLHAFPLAGIVTHSGQRLGVGDRRTCGANEVNSILVRGVFFSTQIMTEAVGRSDSCSSSQVEKRLPIPFPP